MANRDRDDDLGADDLDPRVVKAKRCWQLAEDAYGDQLKAELEDLRFVDDPDGQWDENTRTSRAGGLVNGVIVPSRPTLTIDKITPAINQVRNQATNARLAVKVKPKGRRANQQTAEMLQGLYRNIEVESKAHRARMWALDRAAKCGRGYYRVLTAYANDGDFDLDIIISRILNQHSVRLDPFHKEPDGSDAEWCLITEDVPYDRFKRDYKDKSKLADDGLSDEALTGLGADAPGWVGGDATARTIRVAEYWYVEYETKTLVLTTSGWKGFQKDKPAGAGEIVASREVRTRQVKWCKVTAVDVLDERDWNGRYIPIIQVLGAESNINGERRYRGLVSKAKDANRMFNVMFSRQMETIGLASNAPWIIEEGSIEGYEDLWAQAAQKNLPYLPFKRTNLHGGEATPPQRNVAEPPIQAITLALTQAQNAIQSTTETFDPSLGKAQSRTQSGRAIAELQQQSEQGNSHFLENLAQDAMVHEARIVLDLMKSVYDRPGRIAQILGEDDAPSEVVLNQPFVTDENGRPVPVPPGAMPPEAKHYDLTQGEYAVTVSIGKSFSTLREEGNAMMGQLAQAAPQLVPMYADLWVRSMDFPGKDEIADRIKRALPPNLLADEQQPADPAQLQAQNAALQQQMQAMGQALQQAQSKLDVEQLKAESKERIEAAKLAHEREIEAMKLELGRLKELVRTNIAQMQLDSEEAREVLKAHEAATRQTVDLQAAREVADNKAVQGTNGDRR